MTANIWLTEWDTTHLKFRWAFLEYGFTKEWYKLLTTRKNETSTFSETQQAYIMKAILNDVWFKLPSNVFNIKVNPKGWNEFLFLVEE